MRYKRDRAAHRHAMYWLTISWGCLIVYKIYLLKLSYSKYKTCFVSGFHNTSCVLFLFSRESSSQPQKLMSQIWLINIFMVLCWMLFHWEGNRIYVLKHILMWTIVYFGCYQLMQWLYLHKIGWMYWLCQETQVIWFLELLFLCNYFGKSSYIFNLLL